MVSASKSTAQDPGDGRPQAQEHGRIFTPSKTLDPVPSSRAFVRMNLTVGAPADGNATQTLLRLGRHAFIFRTFQGAIVDVALMPLRALRAGDSNG